MKKYERIIQAHPEIEAWLKNRPKNTQRGFAGKLMDFCNAMKISPEEWRRMNKFEARDLAWKYVQRIVAEKPAVAKKTLSALKSWFRNLDGEQLPLDSGRGGKHNIRYVPKKATYEKIPSKKEVYQIIDMASSLRDKAMLLMLFFSGIRVNALYTLLYGHVADQIDNEIITLKITNEIDTKLRSTQMPFYYTFINGEAVETLRQYCALKHKDGNPKVPLFHTKKIKKAMSQVGIIRIVKLCIKRAGMDPKTMWTHSFRKAFRKVVRKADIDDDDKEQLMGHVLKGSREAYFDRNDISLIVEAYQKCDFTREVPGSEATKLRGQLEKMQTRDMIREVHMQETLKKFEARIKKVEELLAQKKK